MLQLVQDRIRDEKGALAKMRLWTDLTLDLVLTVPRLHLLAPATSTATRDGVLAFRSLDTGRPGYPVLVLSTILSLTLLFSVKELRPCPLTNAMHRSAASTRTSEVASHKQAKKDNLYFHTQD